MASRRKGWEALSPGYRKRLESKGITKARYDRGHKLDIARGHAETPEHGIRQARKQPVKYRKYLQKHEKPRPVPQTVRQEAEALNAAKDAAYFNIKGRLGEYLQYNDD